MGIITVPTELDKCAVFSYLRMYVGVCVYSMCFYLSFFFSRSPNNNIQSATFSLEYLWFSNWVEILWIIFFLNAHGKCKLCTYFAVVPQILHKCSFVSKNSPIMNFKLVWIIQWQNVLTLYQCIPNYGSSKRP